jgi:IS5 family transposase
VHHDVKTTLSLSHRGRKGDFSSEQVLRALVVMFTDDCSYRDTVVLIANSAFHQHFVRLGNQPVMDHTFLCKAFGVISSATWQAINATLSQYARDSEKISAEKLRVDTTAVETNIHWPTDSSLLWDSFRTLARLLKLVCRELSALGMTHRFHVDKVKKLAHYISRNAAKKSKSAQRGIKHIYRMLIERVRWIAGIARNAIEVLNATGDIALMGVASELGHYTPIVERIIDQARRRIFKAESVPATEKVYSLFEEHTELLKRGKAGKPVEFGHKALIAETKEKFIVHYNTYARQPADKDLVDETLRAHKKVFHAQPDVFATDKGFYESMEKIGALEKNIPTVSIAKKGYRTQAQSQREHSEKFRDGQRFRAGSEGTISVLKRVFKLKRCLFKGFNHFAAAIGCAVFCHNLVALTRC